MLVHILLYTNTGTLNGANITKRSDVILLPYVISSKFVSSIGGGKGG